MERKHCARGDYNNFGTVEDAKAACNSDVGCQAVYDNDCDYGKTGIHLCPSGTTYENSSKSCIYEKGNTWHFVAERRG